MRFRFRLSHRERGPVSQRVPADPRADSDAPLLVCANHLTLVDSFIIAWALGPSGFYWLRHPDELPWNTPEATNFGRTWVSRLLIFLAQVHPDHARRRAGRSGRCARAREVSARAGRDGPALSRGGRSRTGRVEEAAAAWGVGRIVGAVPGLSRALRVHARSRAGDLGRLSREGETTMDVEIACIEPKSDAKGVRRSRDLAQQIVRQADAHGGRLLRCSAMTSSTCTIRTQSPRRFRARFDERVFAPVERRAIERDARPLARRWAHWAAKEAAYKLAKQLDASFVFSPKALVPKFGAASALPGDTSERAGQLELPEPIGQGSRSSSCVASRPPISCMSWPCPLGPTGRPSCRRSSRSRTRRGRVEPFGASPTSHRAGSRDRVGPASRSEGAEGFRWSRSMAQRAPMSISLSHHGRWVACAMTLRSERFPSSAPARPSEPPEVKANRDESNSFETLQNIRSTAGRMIR